MKLTTLLKVLSERCEAKVRNRFAVILMAFLLLSGISLFAEVYLGVHLTEISKDKDSELPNYGLEILNIMADSPAEKAQLQVGDIIITLNKEKLYTANQLKAMLSNYSSNDLVTLEVIDKAAKINTVQVKLEAIPDKEMWELFDLENMEEKIEELIDQSKTFVFRIESQEDHVIGIEISPRKINPDSKGVEITNVLVNSPAHKADLQTGDVILKINNIEVNKANDVISAIQKVPVGHFLTIDFLRDNEGKQVKVQVVKRKTIFE